jgi:hypothetical protein
MAGCVEDSDGPSGSIKCGELLDWLLKDPPPRSWLFVLVGWFAGSLVG